MIDIVPIWMESLIVRSLECLIKDTVCLIFTQLPSLQYPKHLIFILLFVNAPTIIVYIFLWPLLHHLARQSLSQISIVHPTCISSGWRMQVACLESECIIVSADRISNEVAGVLSLGISQEILDIQSSLRLCLASLMETIISNVISGRGLNCVLRDIKLRVIFRLVFIVLLN
jgi:hypothetical protein